MNTFHEFTKQSGIGHHGVAVKASALQVPPIASQGFADAMQQACDTTDTTPQAGLQTPNGGIFITTSQKTCANSPEDVCALEAGGLAGCLAEQTQAAQLTEPHKHALSKVELHTETEVKGHKKISQEVAHERSLDLGTQKDTAPSSAIKIAPVQSADAKPSSTAHVMPDSVKNVAMLGERNEATSKLVEARYAPGNVATKAPVLDPSTTTTAGGSILSVESQTVEDFQPKGAVRTEKTHDFFPDISINATAAGGGSQSCLALINPRPPQPMVPSTSTPSNAATAEALFVRYEASTPKQLEVAVAGGELGAVSVRAELKDDGSVHALLRGTGETLNELRDHKVDLQSFLRSESIPVGELFIENAKPVGPVPSAMNWSHGGNGSPGGEQQQRHSPSATMSQDQTKSAESAEIISESSPISSQSGITLANIGGWLSVRV